MNTERFQIEVRGTPVEIIRKDIKNLHLGVYPPNGRVRVAAPLHLDNEAIRLAVVTRLGWIRRKQKGFQQQDRQSQREMVSGESHFYGGRRYRLTVIEEDSPPSVKLANNSTLELRVRPGTIREKREEILYRWYRNQLRQDIPALLSKWGEILDVRVAEVGIRRMKTKWGSCNAEDKRIWLNLELAKKPAICLEYILVHEMVHLIERHHNERFLAIMNKMMPKWRLHREELNRSPLSHEDWSY